MDMTVRVSQVRRISGTERSVTKTGSAPHLINTYVSGGAYLCVASSCFPLISGRGALTRIA